MRLPSHTRRVIAPSTDLLHFLRKQADAVCFFTSAAPPGSLTSRSAQNVACARRIPLTRGGALGVRRFNTTPRRLATLETSLLNLDFLARSENLQLPFFKKVSRPGIVIKHKSQEGCSATRWQSTESEEAQWRKWLASIKSKVTEQVHAPDTSSICTPQSNSASNSALRSLLKTTPSDLRLRYTEFDENGKAVVTNGEFKKQELIAKYGLLPRDLRKVDSSLVPTIIVRPSVILINLLHLRLLIKHNRVLVLDAYGSTNSHTQSLFIYDLEGRLGQKELSRAAGGLPYEFRALEAVLISVTSSLEQEFETVRGPVVQVLKELEVDIDREKLRYLLIHSKRLGTFEQKARLLRDALDDLLEEDEDLSTMYLSEYAKGIERDAEDHEEIELLLESYHRVTDEIVQVSASLINNIRNTEEIVKAILDANRNSLMLLDLKFSIGTVGLGCGTFFAALYGMNLKNFIEESDIGFWGVSGISFVVSVLVCIYGLRKLHRVQRVSMWGEEGQRNRGRWSEIDTTPSSHTDLMAGLPGEGRTERMKRLKEVKQMAWKNQKDARNEMLVLHQGSASSSSSSSSSLTPRKDIRRK